MAEKYFGSFKNRDSMLECFMGVYDYETNRYKTVEAPADFPSDAEVVFASYGGRSYEGDAQVIFERNGQLFEVNGGHCSCYGLEGQWKPEATTREALRMQADAAGNEWSPAPNCYRLRDNAHEDAACDRFFELFGSPVAQQAA